MIVDNDSAYIVVALIQYSKFNSLVSIYIPINGDYSIPTSVAINIDVRHAPKI